MSTTKKTTALIGYGTVGQGFYSYLEEYSHPKALKAIAIKNRIKEREPIKIHFTTKAEDLITDNNISTIVETTNHSEDAFNFVKLALEHNKKVISSNKEMIALNLENLIEIERKSKGRLLYEASVAGGIPILRTLNNYYDLDNITKIEGILNSTSNYVLSQIFNHQINYKETVEKLKRLGYTEDTPYKDISGIDSLHKLIIVTAHAYGKFFSPEKVLKIGIENLKDSDFQFAIDNKLKIRLIASVECRNNKLWLSVLPTFVSNKSPFYHIENEYNAVEIASDNLGKQLLTGKGVGSLPTGQALYSDYIAPNNFTYKYDKILSGKRIKYEAEHNIWVYSKNITQLEKHLEELIIIERAEGYAKIAISDLLKMQEELKENNISLIAIPDDVKQTLNLKYENSYSLQFS